MADTKTKGDLGQAMIMADCYRRGYKVAMPVGEDWPYDLIVLRNGILERVQCKYTESKDNVATAKCRSTNNWIDHRYTAATIDWLAVYDKTTDQCFYIPATLLGNGKTEISLRLAPPKVRKGQIKGITFADQFKNF